MSDVHDAALAADAQRRAEIHDGLTTGTTRPSDYRPGDHLRADREPDERSGTDELEAITPPRHTELPQQEMVVITCPHGMDDDRDCRRCSDIAYGTAAPVIATAKRDRKDAA